MNNITKSRLAFITLSFISAISVLAVVLGLFWIYQPNEVLQIKNAPFPSRIVNDPATGNNIVVLHVDYCKKSNVHGKVRVSYVSQTNEVFLPVADETQPKGCHNNDLPILIPKDLPPNKYRIKFHASYNINPLKKDVSSDFESQEFTIGN